jgi:purine-binding chemotaxis protein CheW
MKMNGETTLSTIPKPNRPVRSVRKANGAQVDWEALHRKVLESNSRLALVDETPIGVLEQAWARRAAQIARAIEAEETGNQIEIVVVRLGDELYGIEADFVLDIRPLNKITPVPRVPDWVSGVVNLRGRIISVLDLQRFLGLNPAEKKSVNEPVLPHLVLVETPTMELALLVDEVVGIQKIPFTRIQEVGIMGGKLPVEYVQGVFIENVADNDKTTSSDSSKKPSPLVVLNLSALLADKHLIVQEEID